MKALAYQAVCTENDGVYTIELSGEVELSREINIVSGSYVLQGSGKIVRAEGCTDRLLITNHGVSLEVTGDVAIDGGAVWMGGNVEGSAVGATDISGSSVSPWALVDNLGGTFTLSGNARVCNANGRCAIWSDNGGSVYIQGGQVYGVRSEDGGGAITFQNSDVHVSGGELWGNDLISGGLRQPKGSAIFALSGSVDISGGVLRDGSGPAAVEGADVTVSGGTFSGNAGAALGSDSSSDTVRVSGGTFSGNGGGLYAPIGGSTATLHLSGNPTFVNASDATVRSTVNLDGALDSGVQIPLQLSSYKLGNQVLFGEADLLVAHHGQFAFVDSDEGYVVNQYGRIDTDPSSIATPGDAFAATLGGTCTYDEESGVYAVTVNDEAVLSQSCSLDEPGVYVLQGSGTITRATGFTEPLIILHPGVSLEIADHVAVDGGARWVRNGEATGSAVNAEDSAGTLTTWALIDNLGGELRLSGDAQVRNNNGRCAIWGNNGARIIIEGGEVHGVRSDDGGGAVACENTIVTVSGGELWGNEVIPGFRSPKGSAVYALSGGHIEVSGGSIRDGSGPAAVEGENVSVTGGDFFGNAGAALGSDSSSDTVRVSGGSFAANASGLYASIDGSTAPLHLSGEPGFISEADSLVHSGVHLDSAIPTDMVLPLELDQFTFGDQVLTGDPELVLAHHGQFPIVGVHEGYVVNVSGRIAADPSSDPTGGDVFAECIGGTCTQDQETGVYTITLDGGIAQLDKAFTLEPGDYILQGSGTITRAAGFTQQLLILSSGVSLEITGDVVIDGGAKWEGAAVEGSAIGATDRSGFTTDKAMIDNLGGTVTISGNADICNNNGACGVYCDDGELFIKGGQIHGIRSKDGGGAVKTIDNSSVLMTDGDLWGNEVVSSATPKGSAIYAKGGSVVISGGTLRDGSGPAAVEGASVTVTGGSFTNNAGTALGSDASSDAVSVSGGTFEGNAGGLYAPFNGSTAPLCLSGNPSLASDSDATVYGGVQVDGELTGSSVRLVPVSYEEGTVPVWGSDSYAMTESDAHKFQLTAGAPAGIRLLFDPENNRMTIVRSTGLHTVTWRNGDAVLEVDEGVPEGSAPSYDGDEPVRVADAQYTYAFAGWAAEDGAAIGAAAGELPPVTADATYYAAFEKTERTPDRHVVTFTDGQGATLSTQEVEHGAAASVPGNPTREGFVFKGWDADFSSVTADLTVNALWEEETVPAPTLGLPATVELKATSLTYDGQAKRPAVVVRDASGADVPAGEYTVAYANNVNAGEATATVTFSGGAYAGSKTLTFTISKAANTLRAKGRTVKLKASKLKAKAQKVTPKKAMKVEKAVGKPTYKLSSAKRGKRSFKKFFKVSRKTGKITVKKGLGRGTYKVKIKVTAPGDANHLPKSKSVTIKIKVK